MSYQAFEWVLTHSATAGKERMVLLVIAAHAHKDGTGARLSVGRIAREARLSERSVQYAIRHLTNGQGALAAAANGQSGFRFTILGMSSQASFWKPRGRTKSAPPGVQGMTQGVQIRAKGGADVCTHTRSEPEREPGGMRARARGHPLKGPMGPQIRDLIQLYESKEVWDGDGRRPEAVLPASAGLAEPGAG